MTAGSDHVDGLAAVSCESARVRLTLLPELGAKVVGLVDLANGREWIAQPQAGRRYRAARFGAAWADYDRSGWDECFPNVAPGRHPDGAFANAELVGHGELWSRAWSVEVGDREITTRIDGERVPYRFERRLTVRGASVVAQYRVESAGDRPLRCAWSMHPLLAAEAGMRICVPGLERVAVEADLSERAVSDAATLAWPAAADASGGFRRLDVVGDRSSRIAAKLYGEAPRDGAVALHDPASGHWIAMRWDPSVLPYLGLWLNYGGWDDQLNLALQPCSGRADALAAAADAGTVMTLPAGGALAWQVEVVVGEGRDSLDALLGAVTREAGSSPGAIS